MSGHVFVISEWLPKENCEKELWKHFKSLMATTLENESSCIRAHATRQISHPGSLGKSKYKIVLLQKYIENSKNRSSKKLLGIYEKNYIPIDLHSKVIYSLFRS